MRRASEPAVAGWAGLRHAVTVWQFARYVLARFIGDGCLTAAGALSYTTLLSLAPLIAIAFAMLSAFPGLSAVRDQILADLLSKFVPEVGAEIDYWLRNFAGAAVQTTALGVAALAVTAVLLLGTIEDQLRNIWHVRTPRPWAQRILAYWALLTIGPLLLGTALSLPGYLDVAARRAGLDAGAILAAASTHRLLGLLPVVLETIVFTLIFAIIPGSAVRWREALVGGGVSAVLIEALKVGFVLYIGRLASYRVVYGALAAIPIFLLWMYIVWAAVLFGAVVAAALPHWRSEERKAMVDAVGRLGLGLALIVELAKQTRQGGALAALALAPRLGVTVERAEEALDALARARIVVGTSSGDWVLARAVDGLSLLDFYRALAPPEGDGARAGARRQRPRDRADHTASPRTL